MWRSETWRKRDVEERNWGSEEGSESERSRWECRAGQRWSMLDGLNGWKEVEYEGLAIGPQLRFDLCGSGRHHRHVGGLWEGGRRCPGGGE